MAFVVIPAAIPEPYPTRAVQALSEAKVSQLLTDWYAGAGNMYFSEGPPEDYFIDGGVVKIWKSDYAELTIIGIYQATIPTVATSIVTDMFALGNRYKHRWDINITTGIFSYAGYVWPLLLESQATATHLGINSHVTVDSVTDPVTVQSETNVAGAFYPQFGTQVTSVGIRLIDDVAGRVRPTDSRRYLTDAYISWILGIQLNEMANDFISPWMVEISERKYYFAPGHELVLYEKGANKIMLSYVAFDVVTWTNTQAVLVVFQDGVRLTEVWKATGANIYQAGWNYVGRGWPLLQYADNSYARRTSDAAAVPERAQILLRTTDPV